MSDKKMILENIKKSLDNGNLVKCHIEQHYLHPKDINDTKIQQNCNKHIYCHEMTYSLINRDGMYLMKTKQWHTCEKTYDLDTITNKWFHEKGKLTQYKDIITFTEYTEYPGMN